VSLVTKKPPKMKFPTTIEVRDQARKLADLIDDPHPELATWVEARYETAFKLYSMLGAVLGKMHEASYGTTTRGKLSPPPLPSR
jgi:hypothetical protein